MASGHDKSSQVVGPTELVAANQLLAGKSKPKVKIRFKKVKVRTRKMTGRTCLPGPRLALGLVLLLAVSLAPFCVKCRSVPRASDERSRRATDGEASANSTSEVALPLKQMLGSRASTTTSELSFEFLNLKTIPSGQLCQIEGRNQVNAVSFADNQIKSIHSSAFSCVRFRLKILNLRNNKIESISDQAFEGLAHLQVLILEGNQLAQVPAGPTSGLRLPALRHLNLAKNRIRALGVAPALELGPHLISLNLRGNPIESVHPRAFAGLPQLKTLTLSQVEFQASELAHFEGLAELRYLHLDQFGANLSSLEGPFCESSRKLASLSLRANQLKQVAQFTNCFALLSLDLSYNHIQGTLEANFSAQSNLIDLYLGHNQIEHLAERAFVGLDKLQVLELSANKLKTIHSNAFVPLRASLYELNVANNQHLIGLPALGLEGLINLKAYGNNQLRRLPGRLPAARSLALTYAYHCCDYTQPTSGSGGEGQSYAQDGTDRTNARFPLGLFAHDGEGEREDDSRFGPRVESPASNPFRSEIDQAGDDSVGEKSSSWARQLSNLVSSKFASLWRLPPEAEEDLRPHRPQPVRPNRDEANLRNLSEFVLWPSTQDDDHNHHRQEDEYSKPGRETSGGGGDGLVNISDPLGQFRAFLAETALVQAAERQVAVGPQPEVRQQQQRRRRRRRRARGPARVVIDELVWQMRRIRFAHSLDDDGPLVVRPHRDDDMAEELFELWRGGKNQVEAEHHHEEEEEEEEEKFEQVQGYSGTADSVARVLHDEFAHVRPQLTRRGIRDQNERTELLARGQKQQNAGTPHSVQCQPRPNAFQPCRDLFDSLWLRASIWLVFLFAFLGNICVIVVLGSVRPSSSTSALTSIMWFNAAHSKRHIDVPRFLVLNLALADLLMACYLGILAFVDLSTLGEFKAHAIKWQYSTGCKLAGFLAVLSSELSVFILAIITLERNYAITNAVHLNRRLSLQKAMVIMFFGYVYALAMALMPLNGVNDYRKFSICLPLDIDSRNLYATSNLYLILLISINTLSFVLLLSCYLRMYCAIRGSQAWNTNDLKIAKRMSILVVTDFLCWSPLICVALATLFGYHLVGAEGLKFLIIFVLPLNSVANPFLYAITTKKFKRDLAILKKRLHVEQVVGWLTLVGSRLACGRSRRKESTEGGVAGLRVPVASTMEQIYYKKANRAGFKQQLVAGGGNHLAGATTGSKRAKAKLSRQELLVINSNVAAAAAATGRVTTASSSRVRPSSRPALGRHQNNNNHLQANFQSFERNEERASDYFPLARTHCLACQRRLAAAAAASSALEPTSLNSMAPPLPQTANNLRRSQTDNSQEELGNRGAAAGPLQQEHEMILMHKTNCRRPRIVLDAVEPVVGVAMAPLHLASSLHLATSGPTTAAASQSPLASKSSLLELGGEPKQRLAVSDTIGGNELAQLEPQKRAISADASQTSTRHNHLNSSPRPSGVSSQTVLVSVEAGARPVVRSVLLPMLSDELAEPLGLTPNRPASACAFAWPATGTAKTKSETTKHKSVRATCCSCSCDMIQSRPGARLDQHQALSQQSSGFAVRGPQARSKPRGQQQVVVVTGASQRLDDEQPHRSSSINRLVLEPLAKAWSNLQLSLQSGLSTVGGGGGGGAVACQTSNSSSFMNTEAAKRGATQQVAGRQHRAKGQSAERAQARRKLRHEDENESSSTSTERDQLLLDEHHESVIIDDILQMSSPAKRRLLRGGRRMSRSCDVIIEQSSTATATSVASGAHRNSTTSGTTAEATGSSFYDQNDDQRILLATINQLSARRRKRGRPARGRVREPDSRAAQRRGEQATGGGGGGKRASCTRCRSWSPALLDKLEDCMYQIRSRIPRFNARELQQREPSFEALEQATTTTNTSSAEVLHSNNNHQSHSDQAGPHGSLLADDHDQEGDDEVTSASSSSEPASLSASSGAIVDEEDNFNEAGGLADLSLRMSQKRTPLVGGPYQTRTARRHRLRQQLSGNSDTLSRHTIGTTLTSVSFDSNTNIPAIVSSSSGAGGSGAESQRQSDDDLGRVGAKRLPANPSTTTATTIDERAQDESK